MNGCKIFSFFREYGFKCTIVMLLYGLFRHFGNNSNVKQFVLRQKHKVICDYLNKHYFSRIRAEQKKDDNEDNKYSECIWTAWLQGEDNAPEVIKLTLASMRKNAGGHKVVVLSDGNIDDYIQIPPVIRKKHADGIIGHAHYADVVRMMILARYGGIWLDATTFLYEQIDENAFSAQFYSIGFDSSKKTDYISNFKWIVRFIGGCRGSKYLSDISIMLSLYWEEHNIPIDYFVFDYLIALLYQNDNTFHDIVDSLEKKSGFTNELRLIMDKPHNEMELNDLLSHHNIYTLSYRHNHQRQTPEGLTTNYGYLCNQYLEA